MIFETMHSSRTIGHDRSRSSTMDIGYTSLILYRMPNASGNAGLIRKLHLFPADVLLSDYCSRYNTDLSPSLLSIISYAFIFVDRPFFQINSFFSANSSFLSQVP